jgi:hypothetical protein
MTPIIQAVLETVIGLALLPVAGAFVVYVQADENLSGIMGFSILMSLVIVVLAIAIVYHAVKSVL